MGFQPALPIRPLYSFSSSALLSVLPHKIRVKKSSRIPSSGNPPFSLSLAPDLLCAFGWPGRSLWRLCSSPWPGSQSQKQQLRSEASHPCPAGNPPMVPRLLRGLPGCKAPDPLAQPPLRLTSVGKHRHQSHGRSCCPDLPCSFTPSRLSKTVSPSPNTLPTHRVNLVNSYSSFSTLIPNITSPNS